MPCTSFFGEEGLLQGITCEVCNFHKHKSLRFLIISNIFVGGCLCQIDLKLQSSNKTSQMTFVSSANFSEDFTLLGKDKCMCHLQGTTWHRCTSGRQRISLPLSGSKLPHAEGCKPERGREIERAREREKKKRRGLRRGFPVDFREQDGPSRLIQENNPLRMENGPLRLGSPQPGRRSLRAKAPKVSKKSGKALRPSTTHRSLVLQQSQCNTFHTSQFWMYFQRKAFRKPYALPQVSNHDSRRFVYYIFTAMTVFSATTLKDPTFFFFFFSAITLRNPCFVQCF